MTARDDGIADLAQAVVASPHGWVIVRDVAHLEFMLRNELVVHVIVIYASKEIGFAWSVQLWEGIALDSVMADGQASDPAEALMRGRRSGEAFTRAIVSTEFQDDS